ncbi:MAG: nitrilase-related carbon-nitrogen hydrolase [Bdellovibrionota bacterium]
MYVSCLQTNPQQNIAQNVEFILTQIRAAKDNGSDVIVLPEMFTFMGNEFQRKETKSALNEGYFSKIQALAKELKIYIVAGSHSENVENNSEKVYNTSVTYATHGEIVSVYRKIHLFNLKDAQGNKLYCESDVFFEGKDSSTYNINLNGEVWSAFTIICYDLRFPEIIRNQNKNIDILFVPAAFTWQTGKDHWEVLLRARAIENQCYVVACNQTGFYSDNQKRNYGNSMVVDPWGNIVSRLGEESGILTALLSKEKIVESRQRLPALIDRKLR